MKVLTIETNEQMLTALCKVKDAITQRKLGYHIKNNTKCEYNYASQGKPNYHCAVGCMLPSSFNRENTSVLGLSDEGYINVSKEIRKELSDLQSLHDACCRQNYIKEDESTNKPYYIKRFKKYLNILVRKYEGLCNENS